MPGITKSGSTGWLAARLATLRVPVTPDFLARRLLGAVVAVWGAATVVFAMIFATGNPAVYLAAESASAADVAALARAYGFDRPVPVQYLRYVEHAVRGDFGISYRLKRPVIEVIGERLPATL